MIEIFAFVGTMQVLAILVMLARAKVIAVMLGPEGMGIISVVDQIVQLAAYASALSLPFAAVRFLSRSHSESEAAFRRTYAAFLKALLLLSITGALVLMVLVTTMPALLGAEVSRYRDYIVIAALSLPALVLGGFFDNVFAAAGKPRAASLLSIAAAAGLAIAAPLGIAAGGILGFYSTSVAAVIGVTIGAIAYASGPLNLPLWDRKATVWREIKQHPSIIPFALSVFPTAVTYSLSFLVVRYSVLTYHGEAAAGLLHALLAIALSLNSVLGPINVFFLTPRMNRSIAAAEKQKTAAEYQKILMLVLAAAALPFVLFPQTALAVLFSAQFSVAGAYLYWFLFAQVVMQLAGVYTALLIGLDDVRAFTAISLGGDSAFALLSLLLAPVHGILGVAIGYAVSSVLVLTLSFLRLRMRHGFTLPRRLGWLTAYCLLAIPALGIVAASGTEAALPQLIVRAGAYLAFCASMHLFLTRDDRLLLLAFAKRALLKAKVRSCP